MQVLPIETLFSAQWDFLMEEFTLNTFCIRAFDKVVCFALKTPCIIVIVITCITRCYYLY